MPFVRTTKSNSYFKRFQTKFRRRRECKTDYYARKRMVTQDLNKYGSPRFRLCTRITQSKIICQVIYSMHKGDFCIAQSLSTELKKWGLTTGFTSYSAAYATGLLVARRLLTKYNLADMFKGTKTIDGTDYDVSADVEAVKQDKRPFKAILDIGTTKPTTGNRVFGTLKGACDGGLHVPHSVNKYPGYSKEEGSRKGTYDAAEHKARIMGCHIDNYMEVLKENEDDFNKQFGKWAQCLKTSKAANCEALFKKIHEGIRSDPVYKKIVHKKTAPKFMDARKTIVKTTKGTYMVSRKFNHAERKAALQMKIKLAKEEHEA